MTDSLKPWREVVLIGLPNCIVRSGTMTSRNRCMDVIDGSGRGGGDGDDGASGAAGDAERCAQTRCTPPEPSTSTGLTCFACHCFLGLGLCATTAGHADRVWSLAWNHNGTVLASCSGDKTISAHRN